MQNPTQPKVKVLATGTEFVAKEMRGNAGELLPKHFANTESILHILEGACILHINNEEHFLKKGDTFSIPAEAIHQIEVVEDYSAVHFMPKDIKFHFLR